MNVKILEHDTDLYQKRLNERDITSDIYYSGKLPEPEFKTVGIVGTRRPTPYGIHMTKLLTEGLRGYKINVISGLAIGIDSLAHRQALICNLPTTAVLPSDIEHIYPPVHQNLASDIVKSGGALVTLHRDQSRPYPSNFHERNQLLAAICDAIVVIEAAKRSGTMITVRFGLEMGKTILAVPGRIGDVMSYGTNQLIAQGATPLLSAQNIIETLGLEPKQQALFYDEEQGQIVKILDGGINEINHVQELSGFDAKTFNSLLTGMELDSIIRIESGHIYRRGLA